MSRHRVPASLPVSVAWLPLLRSPPSLAPLPSPLSFRLRAVPRRLNALAARSSVLIPRRRRATSLSSPSRPLSLLSFPLLLSSPARLFLSSLLALFSLAALPYCRLGHPVPDASTPSLTLVFSTSWSRGSRLTTTAGTGPGARLAPPTASPAHLHSWLDPWSCWSRLSQFDLATYTFRFLARRPLFFFSPTLRLLLAPPAPSVVVCRLLLCLIPPHTHTSGKAASLAQAA